MTVGNPTPPSVEDPLEKFKSECSWLLTAYEGNEALERALMGLYYSVKSTRIAPRVVDVLLSGNPSEVASSGRGDDACYVAETMVRTVHSAGDLLAQVVNVCACNPRLRDNEVSLFKVRDNIKRRATTEADTDSGKWLAFAAEAIAVLADGDDYQYIGDFTNTAKHRDYIDRALILDADGCSIVFSAFVKDGRRHDEKSFDEVRQIAERVRDACVKVVEMTEQKKMYDKATANGGSWFSNYLPVTASTQVVTVKDIATRTFKPPTNDE